MSTSCLIAIKTEDGYLASYCHWDGYPDYMYPMLTKNYNSEELARKLIDFGDASSINKKLEPTSDDHSFGHSEAEVCVFYHRDKHDPWNECEPIYYATKESMQRMMSYVYVWENNHWEAI